MNTLRDALRIALTVAVLGSAHAAAQGYPAKTIRIIVPFGAGGPADIYVGGSLRPEADAAQQILRQNLLAQEQRAPPVSC